MAAEKKLAASAADDERYGMKAEGGDAFSRLRALHDSPPAHLRAGTPSYFQ